MNFEGNVRNILKHASDSSSDFYTCRAEAFEPIEFNHKHTTSYEPYKAHTRQFILKKKLK